MLSLANLCGNNPRKYEKLPIQKGFVRSSLKRICEVKILPENVCFSRILGVIHQVHTSHEMKGGSTDQNNKRMGVKSNGVGARFQFNISVTYFTDDPS